MIAALLDELDLNSIDLVGHSFGGWIAMYLAAEYPARISRLVPHNRRSSPPKRAMEREPENRAARPRESLSPVRFNREYSRLYGILKHV